MFKGKKILLGITGGIAAYKAAYIIRLLVKDGAEVKVVVTPAVKEFISHLTLATLSKNPVYHKFFDQDSGEWHSHVDLGEWADVMLVAPATANSIAKMVNGMADNLFLATYLSANCPIVVAPAMDLTMYKHPATKNNIDKLVEWGYHIIPAEKGELASGLCGEGRMAEPEDIVFELGKILKNTKKAS
jgi:phosphopantothenoylcysteine decarboxylase/phosphopantothenate--cysteine ligase